MRKTDQDVIKENHQFIWEDEDECDSWDKRLAKKYYDKLYKEYCLADLSRYKENKVCPLISEYLTREPATGTFIHMFLVIISAV